MRIVLVTGLSGGGKTTALRALEDLGFYCCDNLPIPLFSHYLDSLRAEGITDCAISVDSRQARFVDEFHRKIDEVQASGHKVEVLFLEAADAVLCRRYSETRRRHPLSGDDILDGVRQDRELLNPLRTGATVVNTGGLNVHEIKAIVTQRYIADSVRLSVVIQSFGFKYGLPVDSALVFDVRFLPNPHFDPVLGPMDGRDRDVAAYVFNGGEAEKTVKQIEGYLRYSLPLFAKEGKLYLTIGIGCTGGRHRSVALTEKIAGLLSDDWHVMIRHRDLGRTTIRGVG